MPGPVPGMGAGQLPVLCGVASLSRSTEWSWNAEENAEEMGKRQSEA